MFWTIVGALLFVFVGIPVLLSIALLLVVAGLAILKSLEVFDLLDDLIDVFLLRPKEIILRIISGLTGGVLIILFLVNGKDAGWGTIGVGFFGFFLVFLGIIGSFSLEKWKEFWKNSMVEKHLIKHDKTKVDERGGYQKCRVYRNLNVFIFEVWDAQKVNGKSSRGKRKVYEEYENEQDAIRAYELWKKEWEQLK